jgi:hypothetical protein
VSDCTTSSLKIIENDQVDDYEPDAAPYEGELAGGMFGEEYSLTINNF